MTIINTGTDEPKSIWKKMGFVKSDPVVKERGMTEWHAKADQEKQGHTSGFQHRNVWVKPTESSSETMWSGEKFRKYNELINGGMSPNKALEKLEGTQSIQKPKYQKEFHKERDFTEKEEISKYMTPEEKKEIDDYVNKHKGKSRADIEAYLKSFKSAEEREELEARVRKHDYQKIVKRARKEEYTPKRVYADTKAEIKAKIKELKKDLKDVASPAGLAGGLIIAAKGRPKLVIDQIKAEKEKIIKEKRQTELAEVKSQRQHEIALAQASHPTTIFGGLGGYGGFSAQPRPKQNVAEIRSQRLAKSGFGGSKFSFGGNIGDSGGAPDVRISTGGGFMNMNLGAPAAITKQPKSQRQPQVQIQRQPEQEPFGLSRYFSPTKSAPVVRTSQPQKQPIIRRQENFLGLSDYFASNLSPKAPRTASTPSKVVRKESANNLVNISGFGSGGNPVNIANISKKGKKSSSGTGAENYF